MRFIEGLARLSMARKFNPLHQSQTQWYSHNVNTGVANSLKKSDSMQITDTVDNSSTPREDPLVGVLMMAMKIQNNQEGINLIDSPVFKNFVQSFTSIVRFVDDHQNNITDEQTKNLFPSWLFSISGMQDKRIFVKEFDRLVLTHFNDQGVFKIVCEFFGIKCNTYFVPPSTHEEKYLEDLDGESMGGFILNKWTMGLVFNLSIIRDLRSFVNDCESKYQSDPEYNSDHFYFSWLRNFHSSEGSETFQNSLIGNTKREKSAFYQILKAMYPMYAANLDEQSGTEFYPLPMESSRRGTDGFINVTKIARVCNIFLKTNDNDTDNHFYIP